MTNRAATVTDLAQAYDDASLAYDRNPTEVNRAAKVAAAYALESAVAS